MTGELRLLEEPSGLVIDLWFVRDLHIRSAMGSLEDDYIQQLIVMATEEGEYKTQRSWLPRTWTYTISRFPMSACDGLALPRPPIIEIVSIGYVDEHGNDQTLDANLYRIDRAGRETNELGRVVLADPETDVWPTTVLRADAVTITYRAGYETRDSPATSDVPAELKHSVCLVAAELYKQRSLSVHAMSQNDAVIRADRVWQRRRVDGEA